VPLVLGVTSLNNFGSRISNEASQPQPRLAATQSQQSHPEYDGLTGNYLSPGDFALIYKTEPLLEMGYDGAGKTIAIVGWSDINMSDITAFREIFLPAKYIANTPLVIPACEKSGICTDPGNTSFEEEADLDVEWAGAVAPGAQIILVTSTDPTLLTQGNYIVQNNLADIISTSLSSRTGCDEPSFGESLWEQAAAQGISVFVAAGDSGSAGCDNADTETVAVEGYFVDEEAATPYNVAVGGTEFYEQGQTTSYWDTNYLDTNTTAAGLTYASARGYIPEEVWNESGAVGGGSGIWAGGGGISALYEKPPWQVGPGVPSVDPISVSSAVPGPHRYIPDVSLTSATHDGYLICTEAAAGGVLGKALSLGGDCITGGPASATVVGGTSAAAPSFAGIQALIDQRYGRQGIPNYVYYQLANGQNTSNCNATASGGPNSACIFNDIRLGSNGVPCPQGSLDCFVVSGHYALANFNAGTGYDLATGLGSVNAYNLFQQWDSAIFRSTTTTLQIAQPVSGVANFGQSVTFTASVYVPSAQVSSQEWGPMLVGIPVTFIDVTNSTHVGTGILAYSAASHDFVAQYSTTSLAVGTHSIVATFPGDQSGNYGSSTSAPSTVTVEQLQTLPTLVSLAINPSTIASGNTAVVTATLSGPAPSSGAQVSLYPSNSVAFPAPSTFTIPSGQSSGSSPAIIAGAVSSSTTVVVNGTYNGGTTQQATVTVNPSANIGLTISLSASQATVNAGQSVTLMTVFTGATRGIPTGPAHFYDYFNGTATEVGAATISTGSTSGQYVASIPTGSLLSGQHSYSVIYDGDSNYSSGISSVVTVTVQQQSQGSLVLSNLMINPATIVGGYSPLGVVTLTGNAPAGGATVTLTSNNTHFVQVPPTVTVSPGYNNFAFPISTSFTSSSVGATIVASYNGTTYGASFTVLPVAVSGVTFYPSSVTSGSSASFTVYLTGPAPAGGSVTLTSSNPSILQVPSSVALTAGATSVTVVGTTSGVTTSTNVSVTAAYNGSSSQGTLSLSPAPVITVNSISFSPNELTGGTSSSATVFLTGPAPASGATVSLISTSALVQVPQNITVPAAAWSYTFDVPTLSVSSSIQATVTAQYGGASQSTTINLDPPNPFLQSISFSPNPVTSGTTITGTVTLTTAVPQNGNNNPAFISLTSNGSYSEASLPYQVLIPVGSSSATFNVSTGNISFIAPITVTVSYNGSSKSTTFVIVPSNTPLAPASLTLTPASVNGGASATGSVLLSGIAPSGGSAVSLSSDNPSVQVPATAVVPPGADSATFSISTSAVSVISTATITASLNGITQSSLLTISTISSSPASNGVPFLMTPAAPLSFAPATTGFSITVDGAGFASGAQILWNGSSVPTTFVSSSQLQANVPASDTGTNSTAAIAVSNPGSISLTSNTLPLHLTYPTASPTFNSSSLNISGSPTMIATGDLNHDGSLDLVVGKNDNSGISIFLGNGNGTFGPERLIPDSLSSSIALGDLNGDGKMDIIAAGGISGSGRLSVFLGNGDGTFTPIPQVALSSLSNSAPIALGDFNGDGKLDVAVVAQTGVYVLLGNGDGTFGNPIPYGTVSSSETLAIADLNGDGKLDILLGDVSSKSVATLLGNGDGTFQTQKEYSANGYPIQIAVADFNGDGHPDVAVATSGPVGTSGAGIAILLNSGDGTFASPNTVAPGQAYYAVSTDDMNGDGKLDLVVYESYPNDANEIYLGNGDGTFSSTPINLGTALSSLATIADINNDGAPDILLPVYNGPATILTQSIAPIISVSPSSLALTGQLGQSATTTIPLTITNIGGGVLTWTAISTQPWAVVNQASGTAPSSPTITINPSGLTSGTYSTTITITATGTSNSPVSIPVVLTVSQGQIIVTSLGFAPSTLIGPGTAVGTVNLNSPAPIGGAVISISSAGSQVQVPSTITIPPGSSSGTFTATAASVNTTTTVPISASAGSEAVSTSITLFVPVLNIWIANSTGSLSELRTDGTMVTTTAIPGGGHGIAIDGAGSLWSIATDGGSVTKFTNSGGSGAVFSGGINSATALAIDGSGQVWISNGNNSISALSNVGAVVSTTSDPSISGPTGVAIDNAGNVWISNGITSTVDEIVGGAAPVAPLATAVQNNTLGGKP